MAKNKNKEEYIEKDKDTSSDVTTSQVSQYFKDNKDDHYNYEDEVKYKISTSSLILDSVLNDIGGIHPMCVRVTGGPQNGKSSFVLSLVKNFLDTIPNARAVYARSEGRLGEKIKLRSGIKFITNPNEFQDGTCLIVDSNVYEFVFGLFRNMIIDNPEKKKYFFVIDSADSLCRREDLPKPFEDAHMAPGGAMLTTIFFKKVGVAMSKRGHIMTFISQKRDTIKMDPRQKVGDKQGNASGSNALKHQVDLGLEFLNRSDFNGDLIRENPNDKNSKIIGHWCSVKIFKGDEKNEMVIKYPIKYGQVGNKSVWVSYEICDMLLGWNMIKKATGWFSFTPELLEELKSIDKDIPEKVQGMDNLRKYFDNAPVVVDYLYKKLKNIIS